MYKMFSSFIPDEQHLALLSEALYNFPVIRPFTQHLITGNNWGSLVDDPLRLLTAAIILIPQERFSIRHFPRLKDLK